MLRGDPRAATTIQNRTTEVMESGLFVCLGLFGGVWHPFFFLNARQRGNGQQTAHWKIWVGILEGVGKGRGEGR